MGSSQITNSTPFPQSNANAQVIIGCNNNNYTAGETISGNVFLNVMNTFQFRSIIIELYGIEYLNYSFYFDQRGVNTFKVQNRRINKRIPFLNQSCPIYVNENNNLNSGQYQFPFSFVLPQFLPSAFNHGYHQGQQEEFINNAKIDYGIVAKIVSSNQSIILAADQKIYIVQNPTQFLQPISINQSQKVKPNCCCFASSGTVNMEALLDKQIFFANEPLKVALKVNNSQGELDIDRFEVSLEQSIVYGADLLFKHYTSHEKIKLINFSGIQAGQKQEDFQTLEIPMSPLTYYEQTTQSNGIICNYELSIQGRLQKEGYNASLPTICIPIIVAMSRNNINSIQPGQEFSYYKQLGQNNSLVQQQIPSQWNPKIFNQVQVCLSQNQQQI